MHFAAIFTIFGNTFYDFKICRMRIVRNLIWIFMLLLLSAASIHAQEKPKSRKQQQKELRKKKELEIKKKKDAEKELKKRHLGIQDKATKKRMKKAKKKSDKLNRSKRRRRFN
jgi:beta-lactamase regulating signal transducer with metallopeptidase domain